MNISTLADTAGPGFSPLLTPKTCSREKKEKRKKRRNRKGRPSAKESTAVPLWYQTTEGAREQGQRRGAAMLTQWCRISNTSTTSSGFPTPTPPPLKLLAGPAVLQEQEVPGHNSISSLVIPNGIILFLGNKCSHWSLLLVWCVSSPASDSSPLTLVLPSPCSTEEGGNRSCAPAASAGRCLSQEGASEAPCCLFRWEGEVVVTG